MATTHILCLLCGVHAVLLWRCGAFQPALTSAGLRPAAFRRSLSHTSSSHSPSNRILTRHFAQQEGDKEKQSDDEQQGEEDSGESSGFFSSLRNRFRRGNSEEGSANETLEAVESDDSTTTTLIADNVIDTSPVAPGPTANGIAANGVTVESLTPEPTPKAEEPSAAERAKILRAQAEKARLEAERLDAELTLQKIERLEKELEHAKAKGTDSVENMQREMEMLQAKLTGEPVKPIITPVKPKSTSSNPTAAATTIKPADLEAKPASSAPSTTKSKKPIPKGDFMSKLPQVVQPFDQNEFDETLENFQQSPDFLKKLICSQLGFETPADGSNVNSTAVAMRLDEIRRFDFSFYEDERPSFTMEDIEKMQERIKASWLSQDVYLPDIKLKEAAAGNDTELALMCLEYEYFSERYLVDEDDATAFFEDETVIAEISSAIQQMSFDSVTESTLPPCTRKEEREKPTLAQAQTLVRDILPKAQFATSSKPIPCPGGYLVKGTPTRAKNGDELISAIDKQLERSPLKDKITVCWLSDFTVFVNEAEDIDIENIGGILFVGGAEIVRETRKIVLSVTTAIGITTCWYLSLYPFLLNTDLAKRVDEQLALVEANMPADLSWLTDLSFPLFLTFVGLQLLHEAGHRAVAAFNGVRPTFPTFVPSIITGVTSLTTSFKEPPKNIQAMFDFSIAGPLLGMLGSMAAVLVGAQMSISADPSNFPVLPLEILRQSSLGGGIIETVIGSGVLNIPDAARGTQAVSGMTIPLHPIAVAGYISLVVNALSMLPIGTTDGGRVAMALFGRQTKQAVGGLALLTILILGAQGSDLFLFYFAFCLAFQKGNEIPCRNEVDAVDFSRVLVATAAYFLAVLSLVPFQ